MILEKDIESALKRRVEGCGGKCIKFVAVSESGIPDRIVLLPHGRVIFVELKRPYGGRLSAIQKYQLDKLRSLGCEAAVVKNHKDIEELLEGCRDDRDSECSDPRMGSSSSRDEKSSEQLEQK